jgi:hypothetical protein
VVTYQKKFSNTAKKLEFKFNYNNNTNDFELSPVGNSSQTLATPLIKVCIILSLIIRKPLKFSDEGKLSFGSLYEDLLLRQQVRCD